MQTFYNHEHKLWKLEHPIYGTFVFNKSANRITKEKIIPWTKQNPAPKKILAAFNRLIAQEIKENKKITCPMFGFKPWMWFVNYCLLFSKQVYVHQSQTTNSVYVTVKGIQCRFSDHPSQRPIAIDAKGFWDAVIKYRRNKQ